MRRLLEIFGSPDGTLSASKIGFVVYLATITAYMARNGSDDPLMWLVYGGTAGGVDVAKKAISMRFGAGAR